MSVVTSQPGRYHGSHHAVPIYYQHTPTAPNNYRQSYSPSISTSPSSRSSSVSSWSNASYSSNYTASTAPPAVYSPTFSAYRLFKNPSPPPKLVEPPFARTPPRVFDCILDQLQALHTAYQSGCETCFQRDLYSLTLTSRAWERAARKKL